MTGWLRCSILRRAQAGTRRHLPVLHAAVALALALPSLLLPISAAVGAGPLADPDAQIYRQAYKALDANRGDEALSIAARAGNPVLQSAILWHVIRTRAATVPFAEIEGFLRAHRGWPDERAIRRRAEEAMTEQDPEPAVLRWFQDGRPIAPQGAERLARILADRGQEAAAAEVVRAMWVNGSFGAVQERDFLSSFGRFLRPADHAARIDRLLWDDAVADARRVLPFVEGQAREFAELRLALVERRAGADRIAASLPPEALAQAGIAFEVLRWRRREGFHDQAVQILLNPPSDVVRPDKWWKERGVLVREMMKTGQMQVAYRLAAQHENDEGVAFGEAEFLAGWIATRFLRDHQAGYAHFVTLYRGVSSPISLSRGAYWAGRAAEAAGEKRIARGWYEAAAQHMTTFYGQLGAEQLGQTGRLALAAPPVPTAVDIQRFEARELIRVVRALAQIGEQDRAGAFFAVLEESLRNPAELVLLAELGRQIDRPDLALRVAKTLLKSGYVLMNLLFPDVALPRSEALEHPLVMALIRQESAFNAGAVSTAGARGLMQLMPATAKQVAKSLGMRYSAERLTSDVDYNTTLGKAYLTTVLDRFDNSYILSLAAYNAGGSRVTQWIAEYGDPRKPEVDPIDWIEMIPFTETRNYVQRILEGVQVYRWRYGAGQTSASIADDLRR